MDYSKVMKCVEKSVDIKNGEEWVTIKKTDKKGSIIELGVYDKFWGNVPTENEKQLRELGEKLSKQITNSTPREIISYWKKIILKMAPASDSSPRVHCRFILLGAGYSVSEIKQLERIIDGN